MKTSLIVAAALAAALLTGCRHTEPVYVEFPTLAPTGRPAAAPETVTLTNQIDPAWLRPPTNAFTLGPGDRLDIELIEETSPTIALFEDTASRTTTVVGPDGKVYFNLLPGLDVWGLTLTEARKLMERELGNYIRGEPRLNLTLREVQSKRVWMLGRFQAPGVYTLSTPTTLLEAVSKAGGAMSFVGMRPVASGPLGEELADLRRSFVVRHGQLLPVDFERLLNHGDLSQNIYLQPDDFVYFATSYAKQIYVLGAVVQPRPVAYSEGMTVAAAIAGAYGTVRYAHLNHVVVIRGSLSQPEVTALNYKEIVAGRGRDMVLQPQDIVYVPWQPYRRLRQYADIALNTFVSSVAINAGSSAIARGQTGGAGVFIPVGSGIQVIPPVTPPIQ